MKKGFTLIELLIVVLVISILSGFVIVQMIGAANSAKDAKRKADIDVIKNALVSYRAEHYSTGPVQVTQCNIGSGCTNLDSALQSFLGTAPKDPNGTSYNYQTNADGSTCTITAVLSNGSAYQYSCATDSYNNVQVINGNCGVSSAFSLDANNSGLCNAGTSGSFNGTGPWTWTCLGTNGGTNKGCTATVSVSDLACSVTSGSCSGAVIFKMVDSSGGHAETPSQNNFSYKVCCTGTGIGNDCSATHNAVALRLSSATDAHVEENTYNNYASANNVCLSSGSGNVTCGYATDCSTLGTGYVGLASINTDTNAHVGNLGAFTTKVCCRIQ